VQLPIIGSRVSQADYGHGTVTSANEYHVVIDFDENGTRRFVTGRVQLMPSDVAAPVKVKKKAPARKKKVVAPPEPAMASTPE
jgi:hypothetical protein